MASARRQHKAVGQRRESAPIDLRITDQQADAIAARVAARQAAVQAEMIYISAILDANGITGAQQFKMLRQADGWHLVVMGDIHA